MRISPQGISLAEDLLLGVRGIGVGIGIHHPVDHGVGVEYRAIVFLIGILPHLASVLPGIVVRKRYGIRSRIELAFDENSDFIRQQSREGFRVVERKTLVTLCEQGAELRGLVGNYLADGFDFQIVARGEPHCGEQYVYCFFHVQNVLEGDVETDRVGACHRLRVDASVGLRIEISVVV